LLLHDGKKGEGAMKSKIVLIILLAMVLAIPSHSAKKEKPKPGVRVYDANGLDMGVLLGHWGESIQIFVTELGLSTTIHKVSGELPRPFGQLHFDDYNCQGTAWVSSGGAAKSYIGQLVREYMPGQEGPEWHYFTVIQARNPNVDFYSYTNGEECFSPYLNSLDGYPLREIPKTEMPPALLNFTLPFSYREN
jgi:hypothetical protein